jgi:hypothetical protein
VFDLPLKKLTKMTENSADLYCVKKGFNFLGHTRVRNTDGDFYQIYMFGISFNDCWCIGHRQKNCKCLRGYWNQVGSASLYHGYWIIYPGINGDSNSVYLGIYAGKSTG